MKVNSKGSLLIGWLIFFVCLGGVVVGLRLAAKFVSRRAFRWHDGLCLAAYVFLVAYAGIYISSAYYGLGYSVEEVPPENITIILKLFFASEYIYNSGVICMRLSILLSYLTIFRQPLFKYSAWGLGAFIFLFPFGSMMYLFAFCKPLDKTWYPEKPGTCGNTLAVEIVSGAVNLALDLILILMPMPIVWRLQMPTKKKVAVSFVFFLGIATLGINIGRILEPLVTDFANFTSSTPAAAILVAAEICTDIIVSCVPFLGPLLRNERFQSKYVQKSFSSFKKSFKKPDSLYSIGSSINLEHTSSGSRGNELPTVESAGAGLPTVEPPRAESPKTQPPENEFHRPSSF